MNRKITAVAACALATAIVAAPAAAHVTLQPKEVPAGEFKRLDVRVPNEKDNASTTKVEVQFPQGFIFVSYEPIPGWTAKIDMVKLDKPVESHGQEYTEQVGTVTFTAQRGSGIRPGQFRDFGLSVGLPDKAGTTLTFKALQTYSDGEVVRWIGPPDAEKPAAQVKLTAAGAGSHGASTGGGSGGAAEEPADAHAEAALGGGDDDDDDDDQDMALLALIVGGLGLVAGLAGLLTARSARRRRHT